MVEEVNTLLTCKTCEVSKPSAGNFRHSRSSKTGYEHSCKPCRRDREIQREVKQWEERAEALRYWYRVRDMEAGSYLLGFGVSVQGPQRAATQVIYTLVDPRTNAVHYVGRTGNPERRFTKHLYDFNAGRNRLKCEWIRELRSLGLRPSMVIVEKVKLPNRKVIERERRWIFHLIQQRAPLTNVEAVNYPRLVKAIQATPINYLAEPVRSKIWRRLNIAERDDSIMLLKFKMISSYRWFKSTPAERAQMMAKELAEDPLTTGYLL